MRLVHGKLLVLFLAVSACTSVLACTSDDGNDEMANSSESAAEGVGATAGESGTQGTDTGDTGETGEAACGVASGVCCEDSQPCEVTEDCCEPETYTCYLVGTTMQCADLAMLCQQCMMNCMNIPPDICEMSCMVFCNPP
jgi:hypothetical protein